MTSPAAIEPDTKDWTWVLDRPCPACGYVAGAVTADRLAPTIRDNATAWAGFLAAPMVRDRPAPTTWSILEYACHVRDVHRRFAERVRLMLTEDGPVFANWDQDATAVEDRYGEQDPATVTEELLDAADAAAARYESVPPDAWARPGLRDNGSAFTIESLGRYHLHDVVHHLHDVRSAAKDATIAAYEASAGVYGRDEIDESLRSVLDRFLAMLQPAAHVLEIGSGHGRDARALEAGGARVRRTDVTPGFVERLRQDGYAAVVLDPLGDDLRDPAAPDMPYDAVWASACLVHVARADLPVVLRRLAAVTRTGGALHVSLKEGDDEEWSVHGTVAAPRLFVYWREGPLRAALADAGWDVVEIGHSDGLRGDVWLDVLARRR
ncbi:class I SAM-dependent methyltransferase [Nocardioides sp. DS6]|uniref:Class I SAM-dependent methyltransferase n=1 Tax=Nocardioides eburneus TaxID=3231482 RepID=A0ABV3T1V8_9ACTN